ncbi:MAG: hypothetical protein CLLPBCKN_007684 [Chroococcidiopsis cubana SAG 39.79]|nr:hypothetical protein [Chroococcidiopsis cubana SAG 39.79]
MLGAWRSAIPLTCLPTIEIYKSLQCPLSPAFHLILVPFGNDTLFFSVDVELILFATDRARRYQSPSLQSLLIVGEFSSLVLPRLPSLHRLTLAHEKVSMVLSRATFTSSVRVTSHRTGINWAEKSTHCVSESMFHEPVPILLLKFGLLCGVAPIDHERVPDDEGCCLRT